MKAYGKDDKEETVCIGQLMITGATGVAEGSIVV
jgi:hypothetical protein